MIIPNGECCHRFMNRLFMWSPKFIHNGKNLVIFDITLDILKESLNLGYNKVMISDLKYRWGSCTPKNNLNFNWRLIKAPMFVIEYVIVHELAHFLESNHTLRFWNIVSVQVPHYQKAKGWLKEHGDLLEQDL